MLWTLLKYVRRAVPVPPSSKQKQQRANTTRPVQRRRINKGVLLQRMAPKLGIRKQSGAKRTPDSWQALVYIISTWNHMDSADVAEWHRAYKASIDGKAVEYGTFRLHVRKVLEADMECCAEQGAAGSSSQQQAALQQAGSTLLPVLLPPHLAVTQQRGVFVTALLGAFGQGRRGCGVPLLRWLVSWDTDVVKVWVRCHPGAAPLQKELHVGCLIRPDGSGVLVLLPSIWLKGAQGLWATAAAALPGTYKAAHFAEHLPALVAAAAEGLPPLPAPTAAAAVDLLYQLQLPMGPFQPAAAGSAASRVILLVDGAPQHTAGISKAAIRKQGLLVVQTPPDSRDLNPIEDCFPVFQRLLKDKVISASNNQELLAELNRVWSSKEVRAEAAKVMQGYPKRLQRVADLKYERLPGYATRG